VRAIEPSTAQRRPRIARPAIVGHDGLPGDGPEATTAAGSSADSLTGAIPPSSVPPRMSACRTPGASTASAAAAAAARLRASNEICTSIGGEGKRGEQKGEETVNFIERVCAIPAPNSGRRSLCRQQNKMGPCGSNPPRPDPQASPHSAQRRFLERSAYSRLSCGLCSRELQVLGRDRQPVQRPETIRLPRDESASSPRETSVHRTGRQRNSVTSRFARGY